MGGNIVENAFGIVAMVAMTPLITIQLLGVVFSIREKKQRTEQPAEKTPTEENLIELEADE